MTRTPWSRSSLSDPVTKALSGALDRVEDALAFVVGMMLLALILVIVYDVVARQVGVTSAPWTVPLAEYYVIYLTFLPAAWILRHNGHVGVEFLAGKLGPGRAAVLSMLTLVIALVACTIAAWYSLALVRDDYTRDVVLTSGGLEAPRWVVRAAIPLGFTLLAAELCRSIARTTARRRAP